MRVNRSAVAALAAVMAVAVWVMVGAGQTAGQQQPARTAQPAAAQRPPSTPSPGAVPGTGAQSRLPLEPLGVRGEAIWPAFEGWGPDKNDGTSLILIGYNNRNTDQEIDVPIGPNNHIEPGGPDYGQPTHFLTGRQWGVFAVAVPKDFGTRKLTWTLTANGHVSVVQFWLNPPYWVDFYRHSATLNEPPVIRFSPDGPAMTGPPSGIAQTLAGTVTQPVKLNLWVTDEPNKTVFDPNPERARGRNRGRGAAGAGIDPAGGGADPAPGAGAAARGGRGGQGRAAGTDTPPDAAAGGSAATGRGGRGGLIFDLGGASGGGIRGGGARRGAGPQPEVVVIWTKYRGPGWVSIDDERIELRNGGDPTKVMQAETEAWFDRPGEYWLRAQVNDNSGDGGRGEQCCWTTAHVKVNVK
jgi:hypothetical protein